MHLTEKKRAIIESKRGKHAAAGMNGAAMDRVLLALFPDIRADGVDSFANGYYAGLEGQARMDSAYNYDGEKMRNELMARGFDVKLDSLDRVRELHGRVFGRR
ncbi:hypothetical protein KE423_003899 [Salmonella enterica]|nr:hypothetical protein [Salmonella enterica]